jgi:hypothetical protein
VTSAEGFNGNVEMTDGVSFVGNQIIVDADGSVVIALLSSASDVTVAAANSIFSADTDVTTPNILAVTQATLTAETGTIGQLGRELSIENTNQTMPVSTLQGPQVFAYAGSTATNGTTLQDGSTVGVFADMGVSINLFGNILGHEVSPTTVSNFAEQLSPGFVVLNATNQGDFLPTGSGARVVGGQLYDDYRIATGGSMSSVLDYAPGTMLPMFEGTASGAYSTDHNRLAPHFDITPTQLWTIEDGGK